VKILLDHCVPRRLGRAFPAHVVRTAAQEGWDELRNGKLLAAAASRFDLLLTVDKNIKREQNLAKLPIAVIVIRANSNRLSDLLAFVPAIEKGLSNLKPKTLVEVTLP
jgi:predicted nuclease of predicted toxin-antitoxin system